MQRNQAERDFAKVIVARAREYLGLPYVSHSLVGSHERPEVFINRKDAFDCVTYVECVLAESRCLGLGQEVSGSDYDEELKRLRYRQGVLGWNTRLHYFSDWLDTHAKEGILKEVFPLQAKTKRRLSFLEHYPALDMELGFIPLDTLDAALEQIQPGDILAFGTTRENLDAAHCGFFDRSADGVPLLLHATKALGKVVEEPLAAFLKRFGESPGLLVYRPQ